MCLARYEILGHPQAWTPLRGSPALGAATHSSLLGGSLKAVGFGDGFFPWLNTYRNLLRFFYLLLQTVPQFFRHIAA